MLHLPGAAGTIFAGLQHAKAVLCKQLRPDADVVLCLELWH